jgi:spore maturation protein CgeB
MSSHDGAPQPARQATADFADLRVLLIGARLSADSMEAHVLEALRTLGCTAEYASTALWVDAMGPKGNALLYKAAHTLLREPERLAERALLETAAHLQPHLVLVLQGNHLSPKTVAALRQRVACPIVCWCQDHIGTLGRQYMLGADYDAVFVKDRYMQELFSAMIRGTPFIYLPEACNPRVHRPLELTLEDRRRYGCDVMIFGSLYYYRQAILRQLEAFDLKRWGSEPSWFVNRLARPRVGGDIVLDQKARAVRAATIALNPLHYGEIDSLNCRAFELAGCGAFQLVSWKPVLSEHFTPGVDLDAFRTVDELIDKIRHYLGHPDRALDMARAGQQRAHRDHTYEARLRTVFHHALQRPAHSSAPHTELPVATARTARS